MKLPLLTLTLALSGVCAANQDPPRHVRVSVQWIEVPHPVLTELTAGEKKDGSALHDVVMAHVKAGKAKIVETGIVVCRSGGKATFESIREEIFLTEYNPPGSIGDIPPMDPLHRSFTAFATRNTGVTMEVEPTMSDDHGLIDLRFLPEIVARGRSITWKEHKDLWGDASIRMPVFERSSVNTSLTVATGKFELASVISPKSTLPAPAVLKKILIFVRADVVALFR